MSQKTNIHASNRLGIGKVVSFLTFVAIVTILPESFKKLWHYFLELPELYAYIVLLTLINVIVISSYNLVMWYIYTAKIPFFEKYRNTNRPWPWQVDSQKWRKTLLKTIGVVLFNTTLVNSLLPTFEHFTGGLLYEKSLEAWPSPLTIVWQFAFFQLVEGTLFYWSHRLLHHPKLYWIHKKHHQYSTTISLAATYANPLQHVISNAIPSGYGYHLLAKFTSVHYVTVFVWLVFRLIQTCDGHSGYNWSWGQLQFNPWKLQTGYHDFHHSHNVGNYASMFSYWDTIMNTNIAYKQFRQKKQ